MGVCVLALWTQLPGTTGWPKQEARHDVGDGVNSDAGHFYSGAVYGRVPGASAGVKWDRTLPRRVTVLPL